MATFLDVSILSNFVSIFTFLLVFVLLFGLLEVFKIFGDGKKGIHAMIAFCVGLIVMFSKGFTGFMTTFTPWMTILIVVIFFILFAVRMFGVTDKDLTSAIKADSTIYTVILIAVGLILLFSISAGFGQQSLDETQKAGGASGPSIGTGTGPSGTSTTVVDNRTQKVGATNTSDFSQNFYNTLYHPKVLGLMLIMILVIMAMLFLTVKET